MKLYKIQKNGLQVFKCNKGHLINYRLGTGTKTEPFSCPVCNGLSNKIAIELSRINKKRGYLK